MQQNAWNSIVSLIIIGLLSGCAPQLERPEDIQGMISPDSMTIILTDIHLIEGAKVGDNIMGDTLKAANYFRMVYQKYGISEKRFEKSFDYYSERPALMNEIFEGVIEELTKMEKNPPRESLLEEEEE